MNLTKTGSARGLAFSPAVLLKAKHRLFVCCSTVQSPKYGNNNEPLDKAAVLILAELLEGA
jgi:ATP-dependent helicase YprA (DUF1998 family)